MREMEMKVLEENGWTVVCESPLEIRNEDGSVASWTAAEIVLLWLNHVRRIEAEAEERWQERKKSPHPIQGVSSGAGKWELGDVVSRRSDNKKFKLVSLGSWSGPGKRTPLFEGLPVKLEAEDGDRMEFETCRKAFEVFETKRYK